MKRHMETHNGERLHCKWPGCSTTIAAGRKDNLRTHMVNVHHANRASIELSGTTVTGTPVISPYGVRDNRADDWVGQGGKGVDHRAEDHSQGGSTANFNFLGGILGNMGIEEGPSGLVPAEAGDGELRMAHESQRPSGLPPTAWNSGW